LASVCCACTVEISDDAANRLSRSASFRLGPVALTSTKPRSPTWLAEIRSVACLRSRFMPEVLMALRTTVGVFAYSA